MPRAPLVILAALLLDPAAQAGAAPPPVESEAVRTGRFGDDLYVAGGTVRVDADVSGDLVAAGGDVTLGRAVRGDILVAGGRVTVGGEVGDDVRAVGGDLLLGGRLGGDLVAAGGRLTVPPEARVAGRSRLAGGDVEVGGRHGRGIEVYGRHVRLSGETPGDVEVMAQSLEVLPGARIGGTLFHATRTPPRIDPAAMVSAVEPLPSSDWRAEALSRFGGWRALGDEAWGLAGWASRLVFWPALLVTGLVVLYVAPGATLAAARTIGSDPLTCLGLGLAVLVLAPALALVLLLTVLGVWLGLTLLALYPVALLGGVVVGIAWLGDRLARAVAGPLPSRPAEAGGFAVAVLLVLFAGFVPVLGALVLPLALVAGQGGIVLSLWRLVSARGATAPALA